MIEVVTNGEAHFAMFACTETKHERVDAVIVFLYPEFEMQFHHRLAGPVIANEIMQAVSKDEETIRQTCEWAVECRALYLIHCDTAEQVEDLASLVRGWLPGYERIYGEGKSPTVH